MLRPLVRHFTLSQLATLYRHTGRLSALARPRVQFLYLHDVAPNEEDAFRRLLKALSEQHIFVGYDTAARKILSGDITQPMLAFSFDDGLKSCLRVSRIMDEFGAKGCFFVCPALVGVTDAQKIRLLYARPPQLLPDGFMSWKEIEDLLERGHEIGSHTLTHVNLAQASAPQLAEEIGGSFELLTRRIGAVRHFAWPFGRFEHFNPTAAKLVFATGYQTCASAERGCHVTGATDANAAQLCLRRDNMKTVWPLAHILYFLARNSRRASVRDNQFPRVWLPVMQGAI